MWHLGSPSKWKILSFVFTKFCSFQTVKLQEKRHLCFIQKKMLIGQAEKRPQRTFNRWHEGGMLSESMKEDLSNNTNLIIWTMIFMQSLMLVCERKICVCTTSRGGLFMTLQDPLTPCFLILSQVSEKNPCSWTFWHWNAVTQAAPFHPFCMSSVSMSVKVFASVMH